MGKGSGRRPTFVPREEYEANYERIFGKKERVKWDPPPLKGAESIADNARKEVTNEDP